MKYLGLTSDTPDRKSLSARRAWIEIPKRWIPFERNTQSLSARRAWIEIIACYQVSICRHRRSPQGERGLKLGDNEQIVIAQQSLSARRAWIEILRYEEQRLGIQVALRKESVD